MSERGRGRFDNVTLAPASLLFYKEEWQAIANSLPPGDVLLINPPGERWRGALNAVAASLRTTGHGVFTVPASDIRRGRHLP